MIILLILTIGFLTGWRKGFVVEVLNLIGFIVSMTVGVLFTGPVASFVNQFIDRSGGSNSAHLMIKLFIFVVLFSLVWQVIRILRRVLTPVTKLPLINQVNAILGGGINLITKYLVIFVMLNVLFFYQVRKFKININNLPFHNGLSDKLLFYQKS
ncbi:MAG: CvpA family protein [Lentilactobacillus hilgardii]